MRAMKNTVLVKDVTNETVHVHSTTASGIMLVGDVKLPQFSKHINLEGILATQEAIVVASGIEGIKDGDRIAIHHNALENAKNTGRTVGDIYCIKKEDDMIYAVVNEGKIKAVEGFVIAKNILGKTAITKGIILPTIKNEASQAKVISSGIGMVEDGITIVYNKTGNIPIRIMGHEYIRLRERNILGQGEFISNEDLDKLYDEKRQHESDNTSDIDRFHSEIETKRYVGEKGKVNSSSGIFFELAKKKFRNRG